VKKGLLIDILFIILITAFFWMPFLETKFFTEYRVFEQNAMSNRESFLAHTLSFKDLFICKNGSVLVFEIGLPVILMLAFSFVAIKQIKENKKEYLFFLIAGFVSCILTTKYFPWKYLPEKFLIIQFPWRMLVFSSFFFAVVCSINMSILIRNFNIKDVLLIMLICIVYIFSRYVLIPCSENVTKVENYEILNVSGQNNEWLPGMGRLEYLPSKAYNNTFYIAAREKGIILKNGQAKIEEQTKLGSYMTAKISTQEDDVKLEFPYIYYPGYTVRFDGIIIKTFETENGFLGCEIPKNEDGTIEINYTGTKIMNISKIISIMAGVVFCVYVWKKH